MLSILIPVYDYDVLPLVNELVKQCNAIGIEFEIICQDDASDSGKNIQNQEINSFKNCSFLINETNLGRGKNINSLAQKSKYDWLLILDCDTYPAHNDFIKKYCEAVLHNEIVFGGIVYDDKKPEKEELLRWVYGRERETSSILTSNLLIKKEIFSQHSFDDSITKYGYEDLYFFKILQSNNFEVSVIENPTYHLNLETSALFLDKTKTALENLAFLYDSDKISTKESKIIASFETLKYVKLNSVFGYFFKKLKSKAEFNLLSQKPSLFLFDLYKLGYFCEVKSNKP